MNEVSGGQGVVAGFNTLLEKTPERFDLIFDKSSPHYKHLPGIAVLVGGMWIMNLSYWGFNQYIIQRALAAKNTQEAQKGIVFAAFLKMLMPLIIVLPGVAAAVLAPELDAGDRAYPTVMNLLPAGILGLVFAALIAAIISSLASMMNSISTIFTMDIYRHYGGKDHSEQALVRTGRIASFYCDRHRNNHRQTAAWPVRPGVSVYPGFHRLFSHPASVHCFLLGFFWKKTTANAALLTALGSFFYSLFFYVFLPEFPFMNRVGAVFVMALLTGLIVTAIQGVDDHPKAVDYGEVNTSTTASFNVAAVVIVLMLTALYATWW